MILFISNSGVFDECEDKMPKGIILSEGAREEISLASGVVTKHATSTGKGKHGIPREEYRFIEILPDCPHEYPEKVRVVVWHPRKLKTRFFSVVGSEGEDLLLRKTSSNSFAPGEKIYFAPPAEGGRYSRVLVKELRRTRPRETYILPKSVQRQELVPTELPVVTDDDWWG